VVAVKIMFPPEKIRAILVPEIETALNGRKVEVGEISLALFGGISFELQELKIYQPEGFGNEPFIKLKQLSIEVKILPLLSKQVEIDKIFIDEPEINILVDPILNECYKDLLSTESDTSKTTESPVSIKLSGFEIKNGKIFFNDLAQKNSFTLEGINQITELDLDKKFENVNASGFLEIQKINFQGTSKTKIEGIYFKLEHSSNLNLQAANFTLNEGKLKINQLELSAKGFVNDFDKEIKNIELDVKSNKIDIGGVLALVSSTSEEMKNLKSSGTTEFQVSAKGQIGENQKPQIIGSLKVSDANVQYPIVPKPIEKINVDLNFTEKELTVSKFNAKMGSNNLKLTAFVSDFDKPFVKAELQTSFNLAELKDFYPLENGLEISGKLEADVKIEGLVDSMSVQKPPKTFGKILLGNASIKYPQVPKPISNLNIDANFTENELDLKNLTANFGENPISLQAKISNLQNPTLDAKMNATMNLAEVKDFYPLENGMVLNGKINAKVNAKGNVKNYEKMDVQGEILLDKIFAELPQNLLLKPLSEINGKIQLTNKLISASQLSLKIAKSDLALRNFQVTKFLPVVLGEKDAKLPEINFEITSNLLDFDEFLPLDTTKTEPLEPLPNLTLGAKFDLKTLRYGKTDYKNIRGEVSLKNQAVDLTKLNVNLFGGTISGNVNWNAKNVRKSTFQANIQVSKVDATEYFKSDNFLASIGTGKTKNLDKYVFGKLSLGGNYAGSLDDTLGLIPQTLNGKGSLQLDNGKLVNFKGIQKLSKIPGLAALNFDSFEIDHADHTYTLENGKILFKNIDYKGKGTNFSGNGWVSLENKTDLLLGTTLSKSLSDKVDVGKMLGGINSVSQFGDAVLKDKDGRVSFDFRIEGEVSDPNVSADFTKQKNKVKEMAEQKLREEADKLKKKATDEAEKAKKKLEDEAKKKLKGLFKK
ncbi:AsmA family protein, partial [bacterium]|nr:AsmA family protein [bacterium]